MSVSFYVAGIDLDFDQQLKYNFANERAAELLRHLDIEPYDDRCLTGEIVSAELKKKINTFLSKPEPKRDEGVINDNLIQCPDKRGHHNRAKVLLELCEIAGDIGRIYWA